MFFADKRVIPLLPKLLGKQFFKKKKLPLPIDLTHKNRKEQIERGCCSGLLFFGTETCSVIRVAKVSMERDEIMENVRAAIDGAVGFVSKKMSGVRSLHLKFSDSVALPLYQALPDIKLKIECDQGKEDVGLEEEAMKVEKVRKKKQLKNGRIHEVGYDMKEDEVSIDENSGLIGGELGEDDGGLDKKKRKGNETEVGMKKKSKKGKSCEVSDDLDADEVLNEVKTAKKSVKVNKRKKMKRNVVEETNVNTKSDDKIAKKKGKKQIGDPVKEEKKKGRSVSKV